MKGKTISVVSTLITLLKTILKRAVIIEELKGKLTKGEYQYLYQCPQIARYGPNLNKGSNLSFSGLSTALFNSNN